MHVPYQKAIAAVLMPHKPTAQCKKKRKRKVLISESFLFRVILTFVLHLLLGDVLGNIGICMQMKGSSFMNSFAYINEMNIIALQIYGSLHLSLCSFQCQL